MLLPLGSGLQGMLVRDGLMLFKVRIVLVRKLPCQIPAAHDAGPDTLLQELLQSKSTTRSSQLLSQMPPHWAAPACASKLHLVSCSILCLPTGLHLMPADHGLPGFGCLQQGCAGAGHQDGHAGLLEDHQGGSCSPCPSIRFAHIVAAHADIVDRMLFTHAGLAQQPFSSGKPCGWSPPSHARH